MTSTLSTSQTVTYDSEHHDGPPDLRFLHYNDVYHVEAGSREPVGGIARFKTLTDYYQSDPRFAGQPACLTFFSGDAFNPSLESSVTKGKHMVPALNLVNTSVACLGNHDLDFGVDQFQHLAGLCNFPWLCANVLDPALGDNVPLGNCQASVMLQSSNGIKVGVIGLVEREWLDTINSLPPNLRFVEPVEVATDLAPKLRAEGAEMIIAVTHQRQPSDDRLAADLSPGTVDIILSGHDHYYAHSVVNGTHVLRSGTDYKQLSYLEARRRKANASGQTSWDFDIWRRDVTSSITPEAAAVEMVSKITSALKSKLEKPIGYTVAPLDARFTTVRTQESNYGNFVCDIMRFHYDADACIMAAGTIRGDQIYAPGVLKIRDIMNCFPFEDPCVVVGVTGKDIVSALENGVSKYPALEGRFPQVSNINFTFDPSKKEGHRVCSVSLGGSPIALDKEYRIATRDYMVRGKDGFHSLMLKEMGGNARSIVSEESGLLISQILRQYFISLKVLGKWKHFGQGLADHWSNIQSGLHGIHPVREAVPEPAATTSDTTSRDDSGEQTFRVGKAQTQGTRVENGSGNNAMVDSDSEDEGDASSTPRLESQHPENELIIMRKVMRKWSRLAGLRLKMPATKGQEFCTQWTRAIAPKIEGRIIRVGA